MYTFIKLKIPWQKKKLIIIDIIQLYYTLLNINNGAELMFLFSIGLSRLINKLSLISNKNLLVPWARMVKSTNEGLWLQRRRWSRLKLSAESFTFLKVNEEILMCSPDLTFVTVVNVYFFVDLQKIWLLQNGCSCIRNIGEKLK